MFFYQSSKCVRMSASLPRMLVIYLCIGKTVLVMLSRHRHRVKVVTTYWTQQLSSKHKPYLLVYLQTSSVHCNVCNGCDYFLSRTCTPKCDVKLNGIYMYYFETHYRNIYMHIFIMLLLHGILCMLLNAELEKFALLQKQWHWHYQLIVLVAAELTFVRVERW